MKISYKKEFNEGYHYNQTVRITNNNEDFIKLVNNKINLDLTIILQKEVLSYNEVKLKMYLKPIKEGKNFLTCTTRDYIFNGILGVHVKDRNTILIV